MLTTKDINNILTAVEKVFDRSMDDKLRPLNGQFADFRREFRGFKQEMQEFRGDMEEFKRKMYEFQKEMYEFKDEMTEFRDQTQKILENIFDDLQTKHDTEKQLKDRLVNLEEIHLGGQHLPAFKTLS